MPARVYTSRSPVPSGYIWVIGNQRVITLPCRVSLLNSNGGAKAALAPVLPTAGWIAATTADCARIERQRLTGLEDRQPGGLHHRLGVLRVQDVFFDLGDEQERSHHRVRVQGDAVNPQLDQKAGELRVVAGRLSADANLAPGAFCAGNRRGDGALDRLVALVKAASHNLGVPVHAKDKLDRK